MPVPLVATADVRAILGVSAKELPDTVLASPIYSTQLKEDLLDMHPQMVADFARLNELTVSAAAEERFLDLIKAYAAYNVASQCLGSLPLFAPLTIMDEKAELTRNADFYANLKADVLTVRSAIAARLQAAYAKVNPDAAAPVSVERVYGVTVGLAVDPITGV